MRSLMAPWVLLGFLGQSLFFSRFLVQWIASERAKRTVVPTAFWWFSIVGGVITLVYALGNKDLPIVMGQAIGLLVYTRNLMLGRERDPGSGAAPAA